MKNNLKKMAVAIPTISIPTGTVDPKIMVVTIIDYVLYFVGALALGFVIWGGVQYVTSGGDAEKTTKARNTLLYAVAGVIVVVLAYGIVNWAATLNGNLS